MTPLQRPPAFTLVELMVSMAVMIVLLLILLSMVNQTSATWRFATAKVEQFRSARDGFEAITRRLSQATLNTYWDYERDPMTGAPLKYVRQSELRFIVGAGDTLIGNAREKSNPEDQVPPRQVSHAVFFQAPLGFVDDDAFRGLENLVNTWGYFVEFNSDRSFRPEFINTMPQRPPDRYRHRLMELMQPSNELSVLSYTSGIGKYKAGVANNLLYSSAKPPGGYTGREWFTDPLALTSQSPVHVLAENVVALVLLPKLTPQEDATGTKLADAYRYDSTDTRTDPKIDPKNQLPPVVQITMVAIDEVSANRVADGGAPPDFGISTLFQTDKAGSANRYLTDLETLQQTMSEQRMGFRVFTTNVSIRGAKWSRD